MTKSRVLVEFWGLLRQEMKSWLAPLVSLFVLVGHLLDLEEPARLAGEGGDEHDAPARPPEQLDGGLLVLGEIAARGHRLRRGGRPAAIGEPGAEQPHEEDPRAHGEG